MATQNPDFSLPPALAVRSEVIMWRLNKLLGRKVDKVDVEYDIRNAEHRVTVRFQNGYVATCREAEISSEEFHAQCLMVCDLVGE